MPPNDHGHKSWSGSPPATRDNRTTGLTDLAHSHNLIGRSGKQFGIDPNRGMALEYLTHLSRHPLQTGVIVYSQPYTNWYKVQLDGSSTSVGCELGTDGGYNVGPRSSRVIPPYTGVVVWTPPGRRWGIILATFPQPQQDARIVTPDWVFQGSQSGVKRESTYTDPFKVLYRGGGIEDFSAGRPLDGTTLDEGQFTETGLGRHMDPFLEFMRVSEICGIWGHYFDHHMRWAAWQLDMQTAAHELIVRNDEGENRLAEMHNVYPWETLGLYTQGSDVHHAFDDKAVQFDIPKGHFDLADGEEDLQAVARYQEYGGYLGQGRVRMVNVPAKDSGKRFYKDKDPDMGVFVESIGLDGTYSLASAKQLFIVKRSLIPQPKEVRLPEDQKTGDDARRDNYKFSGKTGGGDEHKVKDIRIDGDHRGLQQVAAIDDLLAYAFNWRAVHPFHYHKEDYNLPEEDEIQGKSGAPQKLQEFIDFGLLATQTFLDDPKPRKVKVDHRYGEVEYTERTAGMGLLPDGSHVLFSGCGCQIAMVGGQMTLSAPGGITLAPGTSFTVLAGDDINLRARNSVDVTAGKKDIRLKGEQNVQVLSNKGGILFESKAPFSGEYEGKVGEDVISGGIILKSTKGAVVTWGDEIYTRSMSGPIVLDANKGSGEVILAGEQVAMFGASGVAAFIGPRGTNDNCHAAFLFTSSGALIDKGMEINGQLAVTGGIVSGGGMFNKDGYASVAKSIYVGGGAPSGPLNTVVSAVHSVAASAKQTGKTEHKGFFADDYYKAKRPGNDVLIDQAAFSYRDDGTGVQYNTTQFKIAESRWQMMVRLNGASGGHEWGDEPKVIYQGREMLPYPGKKKWQDEPTMLRLKNFSMYDPAAGRDKPRKGGAYEDPSLGGLQPATPAEGFKIIAD